MEKHTLNTYHEVLLKMYLVKGDDLISCPNSNCSNYNFILNKNSYLLCKYTECLKCLECGAEYSHNMMNFFNWKFILNFFSVNDLKSKILKFMITKYCNNCNTPIEKAEGCKHIECNLCGYSFCWRCTGDWNEHNELCCMGLLTNIYDEALRKDYLPFVLLFLIIVMTLKLIFAFNILLYIFTFLIKATIFTAMLISDVLSLATCYRIFSTSRKTAVSLFLLYVTYSITMHHYRLRPFGEGTYLIMQIGFLFFSFLMIKCKKSILRR